MTDISQWQVILVDDEPDSLRLIHDLLAHGGASVHEATNGHEALGLLQSLTPTLVVLDLAMSAPDGWEVLAEIRADSSIQHLPVVAITAYHTPKVAFEAQQAGFDAYFPKPLKAQDFIGRLKELVA